MTRVAGGVETSPAGTCQEPTLTAEAVETPTAELIPEANRAAYVGLPGVLLWEFQRHVG